MTKWKTAPVTVPGGLTAWMLDDLRDAVNAQASMDMGVDVAWIDAETQSLWRIDAETRRFWKANSGNAKARRRWRRRDIPNAQKPAEPQ